jgi:hypothetical protein
LKEGIMQDTKLPLDNDSPPAGDIGIQPNPDGRAGPEEDAPTQSAPEPKLPVRLEAQEGGVLAIIPRDVKEATLMARGIIASGIVPKAFRYAENERDADDNLIHRKGDPNEPLIIMGILKSLEVGMPPITGLSYLLPINDRFTIWGDGAVGLVQGKRLISKQTHVKIGPALDPTLELADWPDEYGHEVRYWRVGQEEPYVGRYTVGDARRARLWLNQYKKPWLESPDRMLFNRARAFALRDGFADALAGLAIAEEVRDMTPEPIDGGDLVPHKSKASLLDDEEE